MKLSLSQAWEETKTVLMHDGRLFASVALALLVLPATVAGAFFPGGLGAALFAAAESNSLLLILLQIVILFVILTGQLAITRLAIGPSVTVGAAISHAIRRLPSYVAVALIVTFAVMLVLFVAAIIIGAATSASAMGPLSEEELAKSPAVAIAVILMAVVYLFLFTRVFSMSAAVATTETAGPIRIIRRAWAVTAGNFWRLFGFLLLYLVGTGIAVFAITSVAALLFQLIAGHIEAMSASALLLSIVSALVNGAVILVFMVMLARIYVQLAGKAGTHASVPNSGI